MSEDKPIETPGGPKQGRMQAGVLKGWVKALRSGKYKPCAAALHKTNGVGESFDAIGVLCEMYRLKHPDNAEWVANHSFVGKADKTVLTFVLSEDVDRSMFERQWMRKKWWAYMPPPVVLRWAKLHINDSKQLLKLAWEGKSFDEIADWIEANIKPAYGRKKSGGLPPTRKK